MRRTGTIVVALTLVPAGALAFGGCFYEWSAMPDADASSRDGGEGGTSPPVPPSAEGGTGDGATPPSPPASLVCAPNNLNCGFNAYCHYPDGQCGKVGEGICTTIPQTSSCRAGMFCGCDGAVHSTTDCDAIKLGGDTASASVECTAPAQTFACDDQFCKNQYLCVLQTSNASVPSLCVDPSPCAPVDCSCSTITAKYPAPGCACRVTGGQVVITCK